MDIFFVISGYVITSSLFSRNHKTLKAFIAEFYARRFKRLIPALVFCVAVSAFLGCLLIPDIKSSLYTGIFALIGASNFYLFNQANDYFGLSIQWNLFAQTWSLGVEEQFYLLFPFIVWFFYNSKNSAFRERNLLVAVSLIAIISLYYNWHQFGENEIEAFYMVTGRFWELAVGCITFIIINRSNIILKLPGHIGSLFFKILLYICLFVSADFTLVSTFITVILTALLIVALTYESPAHQVLSWQPLVYIGVLSYSLYLWHWPVIVFSRLTIGIHWWTIPIQLALIFSLSIFTYHFIEKPLRYSTWSSNNFRSIFYGLSTSLLCAGFLFLLINPFHDYLYTGDRLAAKKGRFISCFHQTTEVPKENFEKCTRSKTRNPSHRFIFRGNSHAGHLSGVMRGLYQDNMSVQLMDSGTHPFPHVGYPKIENLSKMGNLGKSKLIQKKILNFTLDSIKANDIVVLSNLAFQPPDHDLTPDNNKLIPYFNHKKWAKGVASLASVLKSKEANIILVAPLPIFRSDPDSESLPHYFCRKEWFRPVLPSSCHRKIDKSLLKNEFNSFLSLLLDLEQKYSNVYIFNPFPVLCPDQDVCRNYLGSKRTFTDHNHLTEEGSEHLYPYFREFLKETKLVIQN